MSDNDKVGALDITGMREHWFETRLEKRKQIVLDAIIQLSETMIHSTKGVMVNDTKKMVLYLNRDIRISSNTVREVFHVLENENVIFCVNPSNQRWRRYLLVKKED